MDPIAKDIMYFCNGCYSFYFIVIKSCDILKVFYHGHWGWDIHIFTCYRVFIRLAKCFIRLAKCFA